MSTRAIVAVRLSKDKYKSIYVHFDGYKEGLGKILLCHYTCPKKIQKMINLGDASYIRSELGKKHNFDNPKEGYSLFYGRDRGEHNIAPRTVKGIDNLVELAFDRTVDYLYMYNGKWNYSHCTNFHALEKV